MRTIGHLLLAVLLPLAVAGQEPGNGLPPPAPAASALPNALPAHLLALLADTVATASHRLLSWYDVRATRAFYTSRIYAAAWSAGPVPSATGRTALALLLAAEDYGLQPANYHAPALQALAALLEQPDTTARHHAQQARFEGLLTDGLLQFARHLRRGQLRECSPSPLERADSLFEPTVWLARALAAPDFAPALLRCQPPQREYQLLQAALARWRQQPAGPDSLARRHRAQQLALTLERWRWHAIPAADSDYVLVNLPAYALEVVRGREVLQTHRLVIGKPESPTPTLSSQLKVFTLSPEWRVPYSIATKELLPRLRYSPRYAARHNFAIYDARGQLVDAHDVDWWDVQPDRFYYTIRQNPGRGNALGSVIFRFANPYEVYLHATYETQDFKRPYRALGHGCMRMEQPMRLVAHLLGADSAQVLTPAPAGRAPAPQPRRLTLKRPMALHVRYATCAVVAGQLRFYPDVYKRDEELRRQLFGRAPVAVPARRPVRGPAFAPAPKVLVARGRAAAP